MSKTVRTISQVFFLFFICPPSFMAPPSSLEKLLEERIRGNAPSSDTEDEEQVPIGAPNQRLPKFDWS